MTAPLEELERPQHPPPTKVCTAPFHLPRRYTDRRCGSVVWQAASPALGQADFLHNRIPACVHAWLECQRQPCIIREK